MPLFVRGVPIVLFAFRMWRRLPASQRRALLHAASRHGPRVASNVARRARAARTRPRI